MHEKGADPPGVGLLHLEPFWIQLDRWADIGPVAPPRDPDRTLAGGPALARCSSPAAISAAMNGAEVTAHLLAARFETADRIVLDLLVRIAELDVGR